MAETLTDVDTFTASIQMPTAGETVGAADLRDKAIQRLANRTEYLRGKYVHAYFSATAVANGSRLNISSLTNGNSGDFTIDSVNEEIEVLVDGTFAVFVTANDVTHSHTNNPQNVAIGMYYDDGLANLFSTAKQYRYSATNTDAVSVNGFGVIASLVSGDTIYLQNTSGATGSLSIGSNDGQILIYRLE